MPWAGNLLPDPPAAWIDPSFCWRKPRTNPDRLDPSCVTMRTEWAGFEPKSLFSRTEVETEMEVLSLCRTLLHLWPGMKSLLWALYHPFIACLISSIKWPSKQIENTFWKNQICSSLYMLLISYTKKIVETDHLFITATLILLLYSSI